jgi:DNA-directed RNA polymerase subunit RPC12/RpoP
MTRKFNIIKRKLTIEEKQERLKFYNMAKMPWDPPVDPIEFLSREIYDETIHLKCTKCNYDEIADYEIIQEITYDMEYPQLSCPKCGHKKNGGMLVPIDIFESDFKQ